MLFICVQIVACSKETNPKKAFDNGDYTTSFKIWETYAKQGDDEAQNYIGIHYYLGLGVNKDYQKADEIRNQLNDMGIEIEDTAEGTIWKTKK